MASSRISEKLILLGLPTPISQPTITSTSGHVGFEAVFTIRGSLTVVHLLRKMLNYELKERIGAKGIFVR
ncbi:MAG: hypothetical protein EF812_03425 [Methanosarcinales archaeon]|nr:MAG: hypothetical protein EF812_03425 [Methanosarcinales archaeon]